MDIKITQQLKISALLNDFGTEAIFSHLLSDLFNLLNTYIAKCEIKIHFISSGNKGIYCIFKKCYIISVSFSTKCHLFHNFIFFCSNSTRVLHKP
jgi:hypothetical protein